MNTNPSSDFAAGNLRTITSVILALLVSCSWAPDGLGQSPGSSVMYEGFTEPKYQIMVAATEIGQLEAIHVEIGDVVTAGQTIAQLEDSLQQSSVKIALTQAEMHGELDAARAEAAMHRNRTASIRELASKRMARPDELVRAETDLEIALARAAAAAEQQHLRKLELERYELQLRRRRVLAPMAGVISQIFHYPGEYLTPGDPAVVQLLVIDELIAVFNVPAEDAGNLRVGQPVLVSLRSTSQNVRAQLTTVSPHIDGESGTVQVRVTLDNRERILKSGDRCTMQLMADDRAATPRQASRSEPSRSLLGGRQE